MIRLRSSKKGISASLSSPGHPVEPVPLHTPTFTHFFLRLFFPNKPLWHFIPLIYHSLLFQSSLQHLWALCDAGCSAAEVPCSGISAAPHRDSHSTGVWNFHQIQMEGSQPEPQQSCDLQHSGTQPSSEVSEPESKI